MNQIDIKTDLTDRYIQLFNTFKKDITRDSSLFINQKRVEALEKFAQTRLPDSKNENYKYTSIPHFLRGDYTPYFVLRKIDFNLQDIFACDVPRLNTHLEVVLNGFYYGLKEPLKKYENGVIMGSLKAAAREYPEIVEKYYGRCIDTPVDSLATLNTVFAQDGIFVYVPDGAVMDKSLQIINLLMSDDNLMVHYHNLIVLGKNSRATVVVCDHTLSPHRFLANSVSEVFADQGANFDLYKIQNEHDDAKHITNVFVSQQADSNMSANTISLHGGLIRNNFYVNLEGKGAGNVLNGLFIADKKQHLDNFTYVEHAVPDCSSNQLYKGILDNAATGAFTGKILVRKDAQRTSAYQRNNNILLTDEARMNTKPQLEIYADDVKCSHGATVGQLDEEALFYLRARGINEREARLLLMYAFAHEIIGKITVSPLKERIGELVNRRLRGELSRCYTCAMKCK